MKTLNYTQRFAKFKNTENISSIRSNINNAKVDNRKDKKPEPNKLHIFEIAALGNLCPETPEEAKSLIPSLQNDITDEALSSILDDIQTKRSFQY